jgi:hypothetical protein
LVVDQLCIVLELNLVEYELSLVQVDDSTPGSIEHFLAKQCTGLAALAGNHVREPIELFLCHTVSRDTEPNAFSSAAGRWDGSGRPEQGSN